MVCVILATTKGTEVPRKNSINENFQFQLGQLVNATKDFSLLFIGFADEIQLVHGDREAEALGETIAREIFQFRNLAQPPLPRKMNKRACLLLAAMIGMTQAELQVVKIAKMSEDRQRLLLLIGGELLKAVRSFTQQHDNA
jgi:hypothetical protein